MNKKITLQNNHKQNSSNTKLNKTSKANKFTKENSLKARFVVSSANLVWCCGFTELKIYINSQLTSLRLFIGTNEILLAKVSSSFQATELANDVSQLLKKRLAQLKHDHPLIIHTDREAEFTTEAWNDIPNYMENALQSAENNVIISMSNPGTTGDNSVIESFYSFLKKKTSIQQIHHSKTKNSNGLKQINFTNFENLQNYIKEVQFDHNQTNQSARSLWVSPNQAYETFCSIQNILKVPSQPLAKNLANSTKVDNIQHYRSTSLQIAQNRFEPEGFSHDVTQALNIVNNNVIQMGFKQQQLTLAQQRSIDELKQDISVVQQDVKTLLKKPKKQTQHKLKRDALPPMIIHKIQENIQGDLIPTHTLRNYITIIILFAAGIRCNEALTPKASQAFACGARSLASFRAVGRFAKPIFDAPLRRES